MAMFNLNKYGADMPICLADISNRQGNSLPYLEQLFTKLRRAGFVKGVRGRGGSYGLAHHAERIWISDIICAVGEPIHATHCKPGSVSEYSGEKNRCVPYELGEKLSDHIHLCLSSVTLEDVCAKRLLGVGGTRFRDVYEPVAKAP